MLHRTVAKHIRPQKPTPNILGGNPSSNTYTRLPIQSQQKSLKFQSTSSLQPSVRGSIQLCAKIPISKEEFRLSIKEMISQSPISPNLKKIAIAYSGGSDSLALLTMAVREFGPSSVMAIFVEHVIDGITESLEIVKKNCSSLGVELKELRMHWSEDEKESIGWIRPNQGRMQDVLRTRRYQMIEEACRNNGINLCLTGHSIDDDLATMIYRFSHSSGIDGLSGMRSLTQSPAPISEGICYFGKPLLEFSKERILTTKEDLAPSLVINEDESNWDLNFTRNLVRTGLHAMEKCDSGFKKELIDVLAFFKTIRRDNHHLLREAWESSSILDESSGSVTLTLRDGPSSDWLFKRGVGMRLLNLVGQIASCNTYPASTRSTLITWTNISKEYNLHLEETNRRRRRVNRFASIPDIDPLPLDLTRRVKMSSNSCSGSLFYPLSSSDSLKKISGGGAGSATCGDNFLPLLGPSFLVQRQAPQSFNRIISTKNRIDPITLGKGEIYTWDGRFNLSFMVSDKGNNVNDVDKKQFIINYCTINDIKEFYAKFSLYPREGFSFSPFNFSGPKAVRDVIGKEMIKFLDSTPGQLFYSIPVVRDPTNSEYLSFPTLSVTYPPNSALTWRYTFIGSSLLHGKIFCNP